MSERGEVDTRRATPLAAKLARHIAASGPMTVRTYMATCLADPEHGYYRSRVAIGGAGDFITAPEISQVFGELLGLWSAVVWQQMGAPSPFNLVEIGPGRGAMMADALRAASRVPGFAQAARVVLVEPNPVLAEAQKRALAHAGVDMRWVDDIDRVPAGPTILLANEYLDVLPISQFVRGQDGWRERMVVLDEAGRLSFALSSSPLQAALPSKAEGAPVEALLELRDLSSMSDALTRLSAQGPVAALFIDYGHEVTGFGDTLQAARRHQSESPLASPGEADLTAMVDFEAAAAALAAEGIVVEPLVTQAEFFGALGIAERASRLMAANPSRAGEIEMGVARLMAPQAMGTRFKVLALRSSRLPALPGFPLR